MNTLLFSSARAKTDVSRSSANAAVKILFYSGHCEIVGGDAKYLFDLAVALDGASHDISFCTDRNPAFEEFNRKAGGFREGDTPVVYLDTRPRLFEQNIADHLYQYARERQAAGFYRLIFRWMDAVWGQERVYHRLRRIVAVFKHLFGFDWLTQRLQNAVIFYRLFKEKRGAIDIFHFNNGGYPAKEAGLIAILVAWVMRVPRIMMTVHGVPVRRRPQRYLLEWFYDQLVFRVCEVVIAASRKTKEELCRLRGFSEAKVVVIHCGLEDRRPLNSSEIAATKQGLNLDQNAPLLVMVGNFNSRGKGWHIVAPAVAEVKKQFPAVRMLVAGEGSAQARRLVRDMLRQWGVEENVLLLGYWEDIHALNSVADIFMAPYTGNEATPYTIKEAMRAGRPVVITDTGGSSEAIEHGVNGFVVPPGDARALADAINRLLGNSDLRISMGQESRQLFLQRFLLEKKAQEHRSLYAFNRSNAH